MLFNMTRTLILVLIFLGSVLAQTGPVLEAFKAASLPDTIKPNPIPKTMMDFPTNVSRGGSCLPSLKGLMIPSDVSSQKPNPALSKQLAIIAEQDQVPRRGKPDPDGIHGDQIRRQKLLPLIAQAVTVEDFLNIALVFQHGDCVQHFMLANELASIAMGIEDKNQVKSKNFDPRNLYALTLDRALMYSRKAQKFGTQYSSWKNDCTRLYVVDTQTTDAERAEFHVPSLKKAIENAKTMATPGCK